MIFTFPLKIRFKQQFIDKRLSMLRAEPEEKKEKADKIVELPDIEEEEEESSKSAAANSEKPAPSSPAAVSAAAEAAEAASLMEVGMEVIDVDAKKRGESEEREIKEAKKIVETLIPESTKLAGIKEAVLPPDCCSGGVCAAEEGGKAKEEIAAASSKAAAAASPPSEQKEGSGVGAAVGATASSASSASTDKNEDDEDDASFERLSKDIVKRSARAVKSLKDNEFDIRFNPDIFQIGVRHAKDEEDLETYDKEKQLIKDAADFLLAYQVRACVRACVCVRACTCACLSFFLWPG